jgi:hypothetical protein
MRPRAAFVIDRGTSRPWRPRFRIARVEPAGAARLCDDRLHDRALTEWAAQTSTQIIGLFSIIDGGRDDRDDRAPKPGRGGRS